MKIPKSVWPNIITLGNLTLGMMAIMLVIISTPRNDFLIKASFIVMFAALTDRLDGKVARRLNAVSDLGKELDSLADLVSFGIAPAVIAWKMCLVTLGPVGAIICVIYPIAGAYRLARYNSTEFENVYYGVPITIAGALLSLVNLIDSFAIIKNRFTLVYTIVTAVFCLLLSFLMVSRIRVEKR